METIVVSRAVCWCLGWLIISRCISITSFAIYHQIWKSFDVSQSTNKQLCIFNASAKSNLIGRFTESDCLGTRLRYEATRYTLITFVTKCLLIPQKNKIPTPNCVPFSLSPSSGALSSQKIPLIPAFVENDLFVYVRIRLSSSNNIKLALSHLKIWLLLRNIARSPSHIHLRSGVAALAALIMETN